jgi:hypothetical protein
MMNAIYTDLNEIPMSRFIDIYNGDLTALVKSGNPSEDELKEAAEKLIFEYFDIVGNRNIVADMSRKNEMINLRIYLDTFEMCKGMIQLDKWVEVCAVLETIGYKLNPENHDEIELKITSLLANKKFRYEMLLNDIQKSSPDSKPDPDHFTRECVAVETHFKMQIDFNRTSAKKYAYYVKSMCRDIEHMQAASRKK